MRTAPSASNCLARVVLPAPAAPQRRISRPRSMSSFGFRPSTRSGCPLRRVNASTLSNPDQRAPSVKHGARMRDPDFGEDTNWLHVPALAGTTESDACDCARSADLLGSPPNTSGSNWAAPERCIRFWGCPVHLSSQRSCARQHARACAPACAAAKRETRRTSSPISASRRHWRHG